MIHIPPLRERPEDVPLLIEHFLKKHQKNYNKIVTELEAHAIDALMKYSWPGNVRELENLVEMLLAYSKSPIIRYSDMPETILQSSTTAKPGSLGDEVYTLREVEHQLILNALSKSKGNKTLAAQMLGISRKSLYKKLMDYGIQG